MNAVALTPRRAARRMIETHLLGAFKQAREALRLRARGRPEGGMVTGYVIDGAAG